MLQKGDRVPHFDVTRLDGSRFRYADIWQRRNLLLVSLPVSVSGDVRAAVARLAARAPDLALYDAECVITADSIPGVPSPGVVVADRWGEIYFASEMAADLLDVDGIIDWVRFVQVQCPECQGEVR